MELGRLYKKAGKNKISLKYYNKAMLFPSKSNWMRDEIYKERSEIYEVMNNYQAAIDEMNFLIKEDSLKVINLKRKGDLLSKAAEHSSAVSIYSEAIEIESNDKYSQYLLPVLLEKRGKCYRELGEEEKAKADFDRIEELQRNKTK